jgi:hypothetical protein
MSKDSRSILERTAETDDLDFKSGFHNKPGDWLEVIKDVVAMANSGGGTILFGVDDDGSPTGDDMSDIVATDPADVTNRLHKYTGIHFHAFEIARAEKSGKEVCIMSVRAAKIPLVFTSIGNYEAEKGKQKTAFNVGTVYFRHGAKSEPGNGDDLRAFLDREVESVKQSWLSGIAKVVEAPTGSRVAILPPTDEPAVPSEVVRVQLTDDPKALQILAMRLDQTFPHRQKEVVTAVNQKLEGRGKITTHDAQCINSVYKVKENIKFCHTQKHASPQYSEQLVDWIVKMFEDDSEFFVKTKEQSVKLKADAKGAGKA